MVVENEGEINIIYQFAFVLCVIGYLMFWIGLIVTATVKFSGMIGLSVAGVAAIITGFVFAALQAAVQRRQEPPPQESSLRPPLN